MLTHWSVAGAVFLVNDCGLMKFHSGSRGYMAKVLDMAMKVSVVKVGGKAQEGEGMASVNRQVIDDYARKGCHVVLMPSAQGNATDELLDGATKQGMKIGEVYPNLLIHQGEERSVRTFANRLGFAGAKAYPVLTEDECFFLYGFFSNEPFDSRNIPLSLMDDPRYMNCMVDYARSRKAIRPFLELLKQAEVVVFTPWAVKLNGGKLGVISGRGGSDASLVAVTQLLGSCDGVEVVSSTKVTDVSHIYGSKGERIEQISAHELIPLLEAQGVWPVQKYALEELHEGSLLGVSHFNDIDDIGTYISGSKNNGYRLGK